MLSYELFLESKMIELINESVIHFSEKLVNYLKKIDNNISKDLLSIKSMTVEPDITFVDIDKDGYLSFISSKNAKALVLKRYGQEVTDFLDQESDLIPNIVWQKDIDSNGLDTGISKRARNLIKIGKLVNKIFPDKYTDKQIEEFVNQFKASVENLGEKFQIVEGDDIAFWYDSKNYFDNNSGSLANSCMKSKKSDIFQLYTQNKDVCKLLILIEDNLLKGRAILWKIDKGKVDFEWFMDRQYTNLDSDVEKFKNYAKKMNWAYKTYNNHSSVEITFNEKVFEKGLSIKVNRPSSDMFPYMDTFKRYSPVNSTLHNDRSEDYKGDYLLENTDGSFELISESFWSEYYGERIPLGQEVFSEPLNDYIWADTAIRVSLGPYDRRGYYPESSSRIVYSDFHGEYMSATDAVYSKPYESYILEISAVSSVRNINRLGGCDSGSFYVYDHDNNYTSIDTEITDSYWFNWCLSQDADWDDKQVIQNDILEYDFENKNIPSVFAIVVYPIKDNFEGMNYLTDVDSYLLGCPIDKSKRLKIDKIRYNTELFKAGLDKMITSKIEFLKKQINLDFEKSPLIEKREEEIKHRVSDFRYIFKKSKS
jgi:hypothetical protein